MTNYSKLPAILVLEDGTVFHGKAAGKIGTTTGEICFNTGTTGYQEIFTDPSYYAQIMVTTNAHIGNYGIDDEDEESRKIQIAGLVCKNYNINYSRKWLTNLSRIISKRRIWWVSRISIRVHWFVISVVKVR